MSSKVTYADRYSALGMKHPKLATVCPDQCEGTGVVPVRCGEERPVLARLWRAAEAKKHALDGWHFVKCPTCGGTGKRPV